MTASRDRIARTLREALLTGGAVLGVLAILVALGAVAFGLRPLVFRSGSMEPTIGTGALALAKKVDADSLKVGQIVSVPTQGGDRVTHRITYVEHQDDHAAILKLRGDANQDDDAQVYRVSHADKVLFSVPKLGYVVAWLSGSTGKFLLGIYAAFLLMVIFRRSVTERTDEDPDGGAARESDVPRAHGPAAVRGSAGVGTVATASIVAVTLAAGGLLAATAAPTWAHLTDAVAVGTVTPSTVSSYTVPATTLSCARLTGPNRTQFTWTAVANATNYSVYLNNSLVTTTATLSYIDTSPASGKTAYVVVNRAFASVTWSSAASNTRTESNSNGTCA